MPSGVKDIQLLELKDTISQLNKTISTQNELISSLQKMLEERNAKDSEKDLLIANLQSQLAYLKNKVFGSTSEIRHDQLDGQLNLFGTPVGDEKPAEVIEPEVISVKGYTKERKPKATYDDKYNSVRSICKHFFTDIVGLSIKFFCVSLRHMSIRAGIIVAIPFHQVDDTPDAETGTECDNESLQYVYCAAEKCHSVFLLFFYFSANSSSVRSTSKGSTRSDSFTTSRCLMYRSISKASRLSLSESCLYLLCFVMSYLSLKKGRTPRSCRMHLPPSMTASSSLLIRSLPVFW